VPQGPNLVGFYTLLGISILLALFIAVYPLSSTYTGLRPEFLCLVIIYWVTNTPQHVGVVYAWGLGILLDILEGVTWGAHGMAFAIVAYICLVSYQRIKNYSVWHQSLWVFVLVGCHQVIVNWLQGLAGYQAIPIDLILSTTVSALCWPLVYFCINRMRFLYRVI